MNISPSLTNILYFINVKPRIFGCALVAEWSLHITHYHHVPWLNSSKGPLLHVSPLVSCPLLHWQLYNKGNKKHALTLIRKMTPGIVYLSIFCCVKPEQGVILRILFEGKLETSNNSTLWYGQCKFLKYNITRRRNICFFTSTATSILFNKMGFTLMQPQCITSE